MYASMGGHTETARLLLNNDADVKVSTAGLNALMLASMGERQTVNLLKQAGSRFVLQTVFSS